ncbi:MAG: hypothetical protein ACHQ2Z_10825 [Elusimicrobiota bacterium]
MDSNRALIGSGLVTFVLAAAPAGLFAGTRAAVANSARARQTTIEGWPERSRALTYALVEEYGLPGRLNEFAVVWYGNGPWRRTVVHRDSWSPVLGIRDHDNLEQTIVYRVPPKKLRSLKKFGKRLEFDAAAGELSVRSSSEGLNYMALNLANDIINETRTVGDARDFYRKTEELSKTGKSSPYLEGIMFEVNAVR